jgi:hypothetical protein
MAITQAVCNSFKSEVLDGLHDFGSGGNTFKIALYTNAPTLGAGTTVYSTSGEIVGAGYTAGGNTLTGQSITLSGSTAFVDFADTQWTSSTITNARGALIYNSTNGNRAVMVLDFGSDKSSSNSTFTVIFPTPDASNAILRLT